MRTSLSQTCTPGFLQGRLPTRVPCLPASVAQVLALAGLAIVLAAPVTWAADANSGQIVVAQATAKAKSRGADAGGDASLQKRVEQLEEQLVDVQVTIGTLESLARPGGARSSGPSMGGGVSSGDAARIDGMETQIRALSAEVQRLSNQLRQMGGGDRGDAGGGAGRSSYAASGAPAVSAQVPSSFGSTTVTTGGDPIGSLIDRQPQAAPAPQSLGRDTMVAALPPAESNANTRQDYEAAYGYLLRQDYGAAEAGFEDFLRAHPNDQLAGNAQYWLGETHFVRGNYKSAASAFLKGYQTYASGNKAPDSLLKLAMSLDRLGQKDAACSSFTELIGKFPDAPGHVKSKAETEKRRLGCR
ncbi:MAG: tol-pal system protein YbgF [Hyphomicrobiaceae bacterium]|nr:tol-pal system protein YbgF [Hyphomicrobiaceae bacterium]